MKTLPLFYYPSTWVWVDDDKTLLSAMARLFDKKNGVLTFHSALECLAYLKQYKSPLVRHGFLKKNPEDENYDVVQSASLTFDIATIVTLLNDPKRHEEITVMVIDYNMPEVNGFELAEQTQQLLIPKILLTGNNQEDQIMRSVNNSKLINRFVQKSEPEMLNKLTAYLQKLSYEYFQAISLPLLSYLEADEKSPLSDPTFIDFFQTHCQSHDIREYYLIDKEGSFLCVNSQGEQSCLVMHTQRSIDTWLSIYGNENPFNTDGLRDIREYKKIPFFGVDKEAREVGLKLWPQHFYVPQVLEGRQNYLWVMVSLSSPFSL